MEPPSRARCRADLGATMAVDREQPDDRAEHLFCSFCTKTEDDVEALFAGPESNICDECVEILAGALPDLRTQRRASAGPDKAVVSAMPVRCSLCREPEAVEALVAVGRGAICSRCTAAVQAIARSGNSGASAS